MDRKIAVVFDMDGVLFDTQKVYNRTWVETAGILGIKNFEEVSLQCVGRNRHDQEKLLLDYYGEFPIEEFFRLKNEIFDRHIDEDGVELKPGTVELLRFLKEHNSQVAIASSSRMNVVRHHIEETGIAQYFDKIVTGDLVTHSKPSPDIYLKACEMLEVLPEDTYAVEDSYNGLDAAVNAGMKAVMVPDILPPTPEYDEKIYMRCDSLLDFRDYLRKEINE